MKTLAALSRRAFLGLTATVAAMVLASCARVAPPTSDPASTDGADVRDGRLASVGENAQDASADEADVRSTVDTYFTLKYESFVQGKALDLSTVIDMSSAGGKALYDYEQGRLQYFLLCWRELNLVHLAYRYRPEYEAVKIVGNRATVQIRPLYDDQYDANGLTGAEANGGEEHVLQLTHGPAGWLLVADDYRDEFRMLYPVGTDFAALQASFPRRMEEWRQQQDELLRRQGPREP